MDTLKGIMIKYVNERGGGLPLTPEEICNCVVLWAQQYAPNAITINGGEGVSINNELVDDNKKVITIDINPPTTGGGDSGLFVHTYSLPNGEPRFKILSPISTNISPVGWNGVGLFTDTQKILDGAVYYFVQGGTNRREWQRAFNFTDDKGLTFTRIGYNSKYEIAFMTDAIMDTQDLSEYVETIEPFTGGNM